MVKIPALELDGRNWKIFRAKLLEHAATKGWLDVLAGASDDGTNDWEGCNALLHELLHDTVPISIYIRLRRNTAHQVFKYLAKRFRDREPIADPRAKKLATCANEAKRYSSAEAPTSENAATERHANAEREDLPTKDLIRGTKDADDRNVGREDPRTSLEASAKGNSAESAETTPVVLESAPHETQKPPQDSLQTTPRLPTEGEPSECKQEVMGSVVTAGRTIGTVGTTEPLETIADVDGNAALGREQAERVHGVDDGDETERDSKSRLQQTDFYCKESRQRNGNTNANVPNAHGLPLEGEWSVCASGETTNSNGDADASNAAVERVYRPSESRVTEDAMENESKGCEGSMGERTSVDELNTLVECCQQLCMAADDDPGGGVEPVDVLSESDMLVTMSMESESPDGGEIPRVRLGGTRSRADDADRPGRGTDVSGSQMVGSRGQTDTLRASNKAETDSMSDGEDAETYLDVRGAKRVIDATDGVTRHADATTGHGDVPCVETDAYSTANATEFVSTTPRRKKPPDSPVSTIRRTPDEPNGVGDHTDDLSGRTDASHVGNDVKTTANAAETVSTPKNEQKQLNSPMETVKRTPDVPNGSGSHADASSVRRDTHCVGNATETAANEAESVRTRRIGSRTQDSPITHEIATPKSTNRWRKVSIDDGDVYVPWNAPIEVLGTANRRIVFGRVESGVEGDQRSVEGKRAGDGDGDGDGNEGDGDVGDTTSGGDIDSKRVEEALLAGESQRVRYSRRIRTGNSPVSSQPPIQSARRPYGLVRRRRRRGRLKIERINVRQMKQVESTCLEHTSATQLPGNTPNRAYGIYRPRRRRGRIKFVPTNVSRTRNGGNAYLGRVNAIRSTWRPRKQRVIISMLTFDSRMPGEPWRDDGDYG